MHVLKGYVRISLCAYVGTTQLTTILCLEGVHTFTNHHRTICADTFVPPTCHNDYHLHSLHREVCIVMIVIGRFSNKRLSCINTFKKKDLSWFHFPPCDIIL